MCSRQRVDRAWRGWPWLLWLVVALAPWSCTGASSGSPSQRVLFVGNSHLLTHALPRRTRTIAAELAGRPVRIALMSVWPPRAYQASSLAAEESYRQAAQAVDGCVLPVATAWRIALTSGQPARLYQRDQLHATREGAELAALTILLGLLGEARSDLAAVPPTGEVESRREDRLRERWAVTAHRDEPQRCDHRTGSH